MKKTILITAGSIAVLLLAGCGKNSVTAPMTNPNSAVPEAQTQPAGNGIINSIKDAMGLGKKMQCTYKDVAGSENLETTTWVDGQKSRSESLVNGKKQIAIFDGTTVYSWEEGAKTGYKFTIDCMKEATKNLPQGQQPTQQIDPENPDKNATDVNCVPANAVDLTIPTDVTFNDQCEIMNKMLKTLPNVQNMPNVPKNIPIPANIPNIPGQ